MTKEDIARQREEMRKTGYTSPRTVLGHIADETLLVFILLNILHFAGSLKGDYLDVVWWTLGFTLGSFLWVGINRAFRRG